MKAFRELPSLQRCHFMQTWYHFICQQSSNQEHTEIFQQKILCIYCFPTPRVRLLVILGLPGISVCKSTCNAGDPDLIPGSGRSTGKG